MHKRTATIISRFVYCTKNVIDLNSMMFHSVFNDELLFVNLY